MKKKIAVVGAGVGGLASAARLARLGHDVDVYEKLPCCGGRANIIQDRGYKFDTGPSFVLMPDFFEELFQYCGRDINKYVNLVALEKSYKIFYPDNTTLTVHKDAELTKEELERIEPGSSRQYEKFLIETAKIYDAVKPLLYECFRPKDLFNPKNLSLVAKIHAFDTYWSLAKKFFKSEKLCYAFTFEAMFIGVSPFESPAFYSVISYTDHIQKIFHPIGGMYMIPSALEKMGKELGVRFHYDSEVKNISSNGSVKFSVNGKQASVQKMIVNADYPYSQTDLLNQKIPKYKYSCSTLLIYLGLKTQVVGLEHHNLFFARDLRRNLSDIFDKKVIPQDPSFYIHVPTVTDPSLAPQGKDIAYILVPVPNLDHPKELARDREEMIRKIVFDRVKQSVGVNLEDMIEVEHKFYPEDFTSRYNIKYGATFGLAHNLMQSAFFRPANVDARNKNVYFTGASTQPGGGLPVVIASSRIVADLIGS